MIKLTRTNRVAFAMNANAMTTALAFALAANAQARVVTATTALWEPAIANRVAIAVAALATIQRAAPNLAKMTVAAAALAQRIGLAARLFYTAKRLTELWARGSNAYEQPERLGA